MSKLFRPKCMRRMAVFMALIAPIVYLFGVSFAGLQGAHGNSPFDTDTEIVVDDRKVEYNQIVSRNTFNLSGYGIQATSFDGNYSINGNATDTVWLGFGNVPVVQDHVYCFCVFSVGTVQSTSTWQVYLNFGGGNYQYLVSTYYLFTAISNSFVDIRGVVYNGASVEVSYALNMFDLSVMYPDNPSFESLSADYAVGIGQPYSTSRVDYFPVYAVPDGSQYWFSQFFARDNFLVRWGENAISANPYGFAPFGYFWRYLDTNVLHLSHDQAGLMAYGYMYYASHVLLFDVGFILVTFFLTFIQKVADKIGGEDHA